MQEGRDPARPSTPSCPLPLWGPGGAADPAGQKPLCGWRPGWGSWAAGAGGWIAGAWPHVRPSAAPGGHLWRRMGDRQPVDRLSPHQLPPPQGEGAPCVGGFPTTCGAGLGLCSCLPAAARVLWLACAACPACRGAALAPGAWQGCPARGDRAGVALGGGWGSRGAPRGGPGPPVRQFPARGLTLGSPRHRHGCGSTATCRKPAGSCPPCARQRPSPRPSPRCRSFTASLSPASWMRRPRREFLLVLLLCLHLEMWVLSPAGAASPLWGLDPCSQATSLTICSCCDPSGTLAAVG